MLLCLLLLHSCHWSGSSWTPKEKIRLRCYGRLLYGWKTVKLKTVHIKHDIVRISNAYLNFSRVRESEGNVILQMKFSLTNFLLTNGVTRKVWFDKRNSDCKRETPSLIGNIIKKISDDFNYYNWRGSCLLDHFYCSLASFFLFWYSMMVWSFCWLGVTTVSWSWILLFTSFFRSSTTSFCVSISLFKYLILWDKPFSETDVR